MARVTDGLLGGISGKIGNLVFYQVNGQTLVRTKPAGGRSSTSSLQSYHQQAFALAQEFLSPLKMELAIGFVAFKIGTKRGIDRAKSLLLKNAIYPSEGIPVMHPTKAQVSSGDLTGASGAVFSASRPDQFRIEWTINSWDGSARDEDKTFVVVYDTMDLRVFSIQGGSYRKDGYQEVQVPWSSINENAAVYVYFSFYSERSGKIEFSDSVCLGRI
ncbi:hypothetical protein LV84_04157 [Algoriphagus ratkowskyi]|uniref:Uncharacterized protein n=1 Tax=Algoriphagus ratkowskyi TaxID=57028 RepID=A0A2W7R207_9BACT|nr:DUF6266 family protein [Algoriphagus ratkowskyi]PZX49967.1 hypothetical protein LV84_04157 [Algoriphagus ratkowskyi]TXD75536.1 hypothetical protein ESW18_20200 [Algoriphagus ratkowskyi]